MLFFSYKLKKTILSQYLSALHIPFTSDFADKTFNEHPNKYNLLGLSQMLSGYQIPNAGIKIINKSELSTLKPPFIAHLTDIFVLVKEITPNAIRFISDKRELITSQEQFNQLWSGIVLLANPNAKSAEPEYKKHVLQCLYGIFLKTMFVFCLALIIILFLYRNQSVLEFRHYILSGISLIGMYISYLLVLKQIHVQSSYADKLCSLLKHNDCNNVLDSDAAKLWGVIGWSEVGFSYFISSLIMILFIPTLLPYAIVFNVCALPYTVWSVWYQKIKARQWCVLCLLIQMILWCQFLGYSIFYSIEILPLLCLDSLVGISTFMIPLTGVNISLSYILKGKKAESMRQELTSIKMKEEVFLTLLKEQGKFSVDNFLSKIQFGNPEAAFRITILTNPHCNPCAKMHKRVADLLKKTKSHILVEYVFSSFGPKYDDSGLALIGIYLDSPEKAEAIYAEWFEAGRNNSLRFFEKYRINLSRPDSQQEYELHKQWRNTLKLTTTPTILINGYKLSGDYTIEDLAYLTDIQIT